MHVAESVSRPPRYIAKAFRYLGQALLSMLCLLPLRTCIVGLAGLKCLRLRCLRLGSAPDDLGMALQYSTSTSRSRATGSLLSIVVLNTLTKS